MNQFSELVTIRGSRSLQLIDGYPGFLGNVIRFAGSEGQPSASDGSSPQENSLRLRW